ncbi:hypothetical protein SOVF_120900 [Spinacia oleracea]|nr:hypothetical protein SOVF_120900 [Spinacia oleracea]
MDDQSRKFERSSKEDDENTELVHLRCCHNNKYLVKKSEAEGWIIAAAEKPEEDESLWSSTLFEPIIVENHDGYGRTVLRFKHVQSQLYASLSKDDDDDDDSLSKCLQLREEVEDVINSSDVVTIIDWGTLVILPKRVAFKSTTHGKYLVTSSDDQRSSAHPCIRSSVDDKEDARVIHEVYTNPDGTLSIKSCDADGFWTSHEGGEIDVEPFADSTNTDEQKLATMEIQKGIFQTFLPIKISSNEIALRGLPLNKFCLIDGSSKELVCKANSILRETKFVVEEVVISREVSNIEYHLDDARIYDEATVVLSTNIIHNTSENAFTTEYSFRFVDKRISRWTNGGSLSLGVPVNIKSAGIPFITENGIEISGDQFTGTYEWGESKTETNEKELTYNTSVPPMTKATIRLVSSSGTCDVPFSYSVREVHVDGKTVVYSMDDGVFTGINFYKLQTEMETKPI